MKIRPLIKDDFEQALNILIDAFLDTDFHKYIAPDPAERLEFVRTLFRFRLANSLRHHKIDCAVSAPDESGISGLAVWVPPENDKTDRKEGNAAGALEDALRGLSPGIQKRFSEFYQLMGEEHKRFIPAGAWDLAPVAVPPRCQRRGVAAALLKEGLYRIKDGDGICGLATQSEENVRYYERFGFKTLSKTRLHDEIYTWTMLY